MSQKYQFITDHQQEYTIRVMCQALEVSESGYYSWRERPVSEHEREDARLKARIQQVFQDHRGVYGSPRVQAALGKLGLHINRKRVVRLMQGLALSAQPKRRSAPSRTTSDPLAPFAPNILARDFHADAPNTKWVTDCPMIATDEGWLYLAVVLDLYSRRVIGWAMGEYENEQLVTLALRMALARRHPETACLPLLHHSDRGSEYTSHGYQQCLEQEGISVSMSRIKNSWDNAAMESFFATLKKTCIYQQSFHIRQQARMKVFECLECFYNAIRLHSTLDYISPKEFEAQNQQPMS